MANIESSDVMTTVYDVTKGYRIWRVYDDGYIVRSMTLDDAQIIDEWHEHHYTTISSWCLKVALSCYPPGSPGFYVGEWEGQVVASSVFITCGENIVYRSLYFVHEDHRGRRFGTRLRDEISLSHIGKRILVIEASHEAAAKNKSKFGYKFAYNTHCCTGLARAPPLPGIDKQFKIVLDAPDRSRPSVITDNDLKVHELSMDVLLAYDDDHFVTRKHPPRHDLVRKWTHLPGGATFVACDISSDQVVGYGVRRTCITDGVHSIGPLYADSPAVAEALLWKLSEDVVGQTIVMDICEINNEAIKLTEKFGIKSLYRLERQYLNGEPKDFDQHAATVYAETSFEFCGF